MYRERAKKNYLKRVIHKEKETQRQRTDRDKQIWGKLKE